MGMSNKKIISAARRCRQLLGTGDAVRCDPEESYVVGPLDSALIRVKHLRYCCDQIETFLVEGQQEKAFRWLGFVQGCLWASYGIPISELGQMNMPDEPA